MTSPEGCRFTETHEWACPKGDVVTVGITQYAADELTDVTYVEMRPVHTKVRAGESIGEVESVKTTSDVYAPVSGEIIEVNTAAAATPALLNSDPFGDGWLVRIRTTDRAPLDSLMDREAYDERFPVGKR